MILLFTSFLAGTLTVLAPCVVAFLPVVLARGVDSKRRPWLVIAGLAVSIFLFSILLKSTTLLIDIPPKFWSILSGSIVLGFGVVTLWPKIWEELTLRLGFALKAQQGLAKANTKQGIWGDVALGASLGPIFSACSPTYALIVASILPANPGEGVLYLLAYILGLVLVLSLIALLGKKLIARLGWGINPTSRFHRVLGVILIIVGLGILTGFDKLLLGWLVGQGLFDWQINLESGLMNR